MLDQLQGLLTTLLHIGGLLWASLWPNPTLYRIIGTYDRAGLWLAMGVALIAGCSLLVGHSGILLRNKVGGARFIFELCREGLALVVGGVGMVAIIWLGCQFLFHQEPSLRIIITLTALSYAPLVMGFLILAPLFGTVIEQVLYFWSALVLLISVRGAYGTTLAAALICVGLAYLLRLVIWWLGRPRRAWQVTGKE